MGRLSSILVLLVAAIGVCDVEGSKQVSRSFRPRSRLQAAQLQRSTELLHEADLSKQGGVTASSATTAILGCLTMAVIEKVVKRVLKELNIQFPAMLGGCIALFVSLLAMEQISPKAAESAFTFLQPGANLVAKWFSMLFVPGLVLLPLSPSIGSNVEVSRSSVQWFKAITLYAVCIALGVVVSISSRASHFLYIRLPRPSLWLSLALSIPPPLLLTRSWRCVSPKERSRSLLPQTPRLVPRLQQHPPPNRTVPAQ